jgi:hypothetical protein
MGNQFSRSTVGRTMLRRMNALQASLGFIGFEADPREVRRALLLRRVEYRYSVRYEAAEIIP